MFKELVSLAIIISVLLNILFIDHPNTASYTLYFSFSLVALSPFVLAWRYWVSRRNRRAAQELNGNLVLGIVSLVTDLEAGKAPRNMGTSTDVDQELLDVNCNSSS
jgi:hypothetical protein